MIFLGSDHGGFEIKDYIKSYLLRIGKKIEDRGCFSGNMTVDYPGISQDVSLKTIEAQKKNLLDEIFGILVCGSGVGVCIAANKIKGIRAALCHDEVYAQLSRSHNDANILCLGGRMISRNESIKIVEKFIATKFEGGRHKRRIDCISEIEYKN